jgi:ABC-type glycerol-3-phosphate transport system substrate-binding protein
MIKVKMMVTAVILLLVLAGSVGPLHAQNQEIVLQLAVPGYMEEMFNSGVLDQFEAEHPGIRVELVTTGGSAMMISLGSSAGQGDINDVLDERETYARSADVLAVSSADLSPEVTRAGYFLDLSPLVNSDPNLNSADFYTGVWSSFQWDGGTWALPVAADPVLLFYDKAAFDAANLPYPDTWRSVEDAETAIRTLTQLNPDGTVAVPGFMNMDVGPALLAISLLGHGVYDDSVTPSVPDFKSPDLEHLLTVWAQMQTDGLFNPPQINSSGNAARILDAPLQMGPSSFSGAKTGATKPKTPALLPGGRAGLDVNGFAISSGTQYPEQAYELLTFLIDNPQVATSFIGSTPARRDLVGVQAGNSPAFSFGGAQSPELAALIPVALDQAFPPSEMRFSEYLAQAVQEMGQNNVDAFTALQTVEETALARLDTASARRDSTQIVVQTPLPTANLAPGEIALKFGISSIMSPLPNQDRWDALAQDFAASDPEVGAVQIKSGLSTTLSDMANNYDCFFASGNVVPTADLSLLRSLDPLLAADPTYDPNDMLNGVMQQVQRDGQTWGLPVMIEPLAMRYNPDLFAQAGVVPPVNGWTPEEFEYALQALKDTTGDSAPFVPRSPGNTHLLMLIAAYGGLPLDYRTDPPTINFTDPDTVAAIQRVLDLAKNGHMDYSVLASLGGTSFSISGDNTTPLYTDTLTGIGSIGGLGGGMTVIATNGGGGKTGSGPLDFPQNRDPLIAFPQGSTYTAVSYDVSAAYISGKTANIDACYRFISELSRRPDLITGMPARHSLINSPAIADAQGQDTATFYQTMDALMQKPNTIVIPAGFKFDPSAIGSTVLSFWLNRAFDRYVQNDANLETELADAELFTKDYQNCIAVIPPYDPSSDDFQTYFQQFLDCAVQVDPSTSDYFGGLNFP